MRSGASGASGLKLKKSCYFVRCNFSYIIIGRCSALTSDMYAHSLGNKHTLNARAPPIENSVGCRYFLPRFDTAMHYFLCYVCIQLCNYVLCLMDYMSYETVPIQPNKKLG